MSASSRRPQSLYELSVYMIIIFLYNVEKVQVREMS